MFPDPRRLVPTDAPRLFDERSRPDFRDVFGRLLSDATQVDVALTHLRLSTLDLRSVELQKLRRLRLLLAQVSSAGLGAEAHAVLADPERGGSLRHLAVLLDRGVVRIRSAPLAGWSPDFTVFHGGRGPRAALLGFHWLERPFPYRGPALTSLHGPPGAVLAAQRFDETWRRAHDIRPAIRGILRREAGAPAGAMTAPPEAPRPQGVAGIHEGARDLDTPPTTD